MRRDAKALANFMASLPPDDTEPEICPPGCRINHDEKWYGVTVPKPKVVEKTPQVPTPERFRHTPPKDVVEWEDPLPNHSMEQWRQAMKEQDLSCWKHTEYHITGKLVKLETPTVRQLEHHAKKYGVHSNATLASVQDVADMLHIKISIPRASMKPKAKLRNPSRKERAQQLVDLGYSWDVIEDELNLTRSQSVELHEELLGVNAA